MTGGFERQIALALGEDLAPDARAIRAAPAAFASWFADSDLAVAAVEAAGLELAALSGAETVEVDPRLTLMWYVSSLRPVGWTLPGKWDPIAGDYEARDGWVRLHTNAPAHRDAALSVLGSAPEKAAVARAVRGWEAVTLETAVVAAGGASAAMHGPGEWAAHPQGQAVAREPLIAWDRRDGEMRRPRGLKGLRVLDLTRVLAGPIATRFLAGFGAEVLRIDPPFWDEPGRDLEVTLGKRCAGLDLRDRHDRATFERLLAGADVLVHGYRTGALAGLGYDLAAREALAPGLIEVSLNAYGHSGPWQGRRGFDSLVQMSTGIAADAMARAQAAKPVPLPIQALDHATGYLMAAAVLRALRVANATGRISRARLSLARTAASLIAAGPRTPAPDMAPETAADLSPQTEVSDWGPARRLRFPVRLAGRDPDWPEMGGALRRHPAAWRG